MNAADIVSAVASFVAEHSVVLFLCGLALVAVALILTVRRAIKGGRPDRWVDAVAFIGALAFSAEGMWEFATDRLDLPLGVAAVVFFLFEANMVSAMYRANRHYKTWKNPGKHGRAVWLIAAVAGVIVALGSDSLVEAPLRLAIPLLAAYQWWLGLTADGVTEDQDATSWRWTPRRLLLWIGAIEPGKNDVEAVDRERRVAQMTALEYRRRYGWSRLSARRGVRLARLSLAADDAMIAAVRERVERASWFETEQEAAGGGAPAEPAAATISAARAVTEKRRRVRHHRLVRQVRVAHPVPKVAAVQDVREDLRTAHEKDTAVRAMKVALPDLGPSKIAHLLNIPPTTVRRGLRRTQNPQPPPRINGNTPDLEVAR